MPPTPVEALHNRLAIETDANVRTELIALAKSSLRRRPIMRTPDGVPEISRVVEDPGINSQITIRLRTSRRNLLRITNFFDLTHPLHPRPISTSPLSAGSKKLKKFRR